MARIGLEQFDVQPADAVVFGFDEGWYEPEYNPQTARSWRWMSQHAALRVHNGGHDLILHIAGESPLRYFNAAPVVRVVAGGRELAQFRPDRDFTREIEVPASLMPADGKILLESSRGFVPADRGATADRRQLALRIYSVTVRAE